MKDITKAWVYIIVGGMFETAWATTMFMSEAFTKFIWIIPTVAFLFVSVWFLDLGMKANIPTGVAYSVWVGIGALGAVLVGIVAFNEPVTMLRMFFVLVIILGIIGLELFSKHETKPSEEKE